MPSSRPLPSSVYWRRRGVALGALLAPVLVAAALAAAGDDERAEDPRAARAAATPAPAELPGGGRRILPDRRVVAFYGHPADEQLGILGIGSPAKAGRRLLRQARPYDRKSRPVLPAMELLAVIANADPGEDGLYRRQVEHSMIRRYLRAARRIGAILILDIQPGRANFVTETLRLERWLREPDVSLALDPEWRVQEGEVPGQVIGSVQPEEVNAVTDWLSRLVREENLPQKLVVLHRFTEGMIGDQERLEPRDGLAIVINADGFGSRAVKSAKYRNFMRDRPRFAYRGFKLFYEEDANLMSPRGVLALRPPPDIVEYE